MHLHAMTFAPNQSGLAKDLEMLRERRLRNRFIADCQEGRATLRALLAENIGVHGHSYRIGQRVQYPLHAHFVNRRME